MERVRRILDYFPGPVSKAAGTPRSRWFFAAALALAAAALGYAIHIRDGEYWPDAIDWLTVALVLTVAGVTLPSWPDASGRTTSLVLPAVAAAVFFQFFQLLRSPPGGWNWWSDDVKAATEAGLRFYYTGVAVAAALAIGLLFDSRRLRVACVCGLLAVHLLLGAWMIRASPSPHIDVFVFQQEGPRALLDGVNPYTITFTDIYHGTEQEKDRQVYGHGLSEQGKLKFGFPYPPLSLYFATLGYVIAGDHRYAQLVALTLAGVFIALSSPGRLAALAAVLLLFTPRAFFVLGRGWTEPFGVCLLAFTVCCSCRWPKLVPVAFGLLLAIKQYMVFAVPLGLLLVPRPLTWRGVVRFYVLAFIAAAVVSAPLVLWDWGAFYYSAATVQKVAPFRQDALSYLVWFYFKTGRQPGLAAALVGVVVGVALSLWRAPRDAAGFAGAVALTYLPFIALNKQAFANYYFFVIGALACAVAATALHQHAPVQPKSPEASVR